MRCPVLEHSHMVLEGHAHWAFGSTHGDPAVALLLRYGYADDSIEAHCGSSYLHRPDSLILITRSVD